MPYNIVKYMIEEQQMEIEAGQVKDSRTALGEKYGLFQNMQINFVIFYHFFHRSFIIGYG